MKKIRLVYTLTIDLDCEEDETGNVFAEVGEIGDTVEQMICDNAEAFYSGRNSFAGVSTEYEYDEEVAEEGDE